jgi:hypothetical protein
MATIQWQSGTLHAEASASDADLLNGGEFTTVTDDPPDVVMNSPSGSQSADASVGGQSAGAYTSINLYSVPSTGGVIIDLSSSVGIDPPEGPSHSSCELSGNVTFNEIATQALEATLDSSPDYSDGTVTISDSLNNVLVSMSDSGWGDPGPSPVFFTLSPGQYVLSWNDYPTVEVGTAGGGGYTFDVSTVPEPISLMWFGTLLALRRRRRC